MRFAPVENWRLPEDGDDWAPAVARAQAAGETMLSLPRGELTFRATVPIGDNVYLYGCGLRKTVCRFVGTAAGFLFASGGADGPSGFYGRLGHLAVWCSQALPDADGVVIHVGKVCLDNIHVHDWPRDGVSIDGGSPYNASHGLHRCVASTSNGRHGIHLRGGDAQVHTFIAPDCRDNGGAGIDDSGFLGNYFLGGHASHNVGLDYVAIGDSQGSMFAGCYSEARRVGDVYEPTIEIGRNNLAVQVRGKPTATQQAAIAGHKAAVAISQLAGGVAGAVSARLGSSDPQTALSLSDTGGVGYRLMKAASGGLGTLWAWAWQGSSTGAAFGMTTQHHTRGAGIGAAPRGLLLGLGGTQRMIATSADKPTTQGTPGDIVLATTPTETLDGWRYISDQQGVRWRPFKFPEGA